jgi:hypothetical protein
MKLRKYLKYQCTKFVNYRAHISLPSSSSTTSKRLCSTIILLILFLAVLVQVNAQELSWRKRLGKLREEALEKIFPGVLEYAEAVDRFAIGFVDYRDPLESINWITLYLPGVIFMSSIIFFCIPHVLNFLIFIPKMWFFRLPCLYNFKQSIVRRRRRRDITNFEEHEVMGECDAVNLAHITRQVLQSLSRNGQQ